MGGKAGGGAGVGRRGEGGGVSRCSSRYGDRCMWEGIVSGRRGRCCRRVEGRSDRQGPYM